MKSKGVLRSQEDIRMVDQMRGGGKGEAESID
jgi:hypothetical protein